MSITRYEFVRGVRPRILEPVHARQSARGRSTQVTARSHEDRAQAQPSAALAALAGASAALALTLAPLPPLAHAAPSSTLEDATLSPFTKALERRNDSLVSGTAPLLRDPRKSQLPTIGAAAPVPPSGQAADPYSEALQRRHRDHDAQLPTTGEQEAMIANYQEEMFTADAWLGMKRLAAYGRYVDEISELEDRPGCEACREHRLILERAWQVVANEFYDPTGRFSQAAWAGQLQPALARHGGALHTKRELYTAAREMVGSLGDPYSEFMDPVAFRAAIRKPSKAERDYAAAQAIGVGLKVGQVTNGTGRVVTATLSGSSAEAAGIAIGDCLLAVDGVPAGSLSPEAVERLFRGPVTSTVDVVVRHPSQAGTVHGTEVLTLERLPIPQPAAVHAVVPYALDPSRVAQYIRINYFSSDSTKTIMQAIVEGETLGVDGYVIDLRNNPGGVFEEAIAAASYFLEADGTDTHIVETVRATDARTHRDVIDNVWTVGILPTEVFPRTAWGLTSRPLVLLVNGGTASASEVLAAALQDNQRAILVGEQTFGKGVVQYYFSMSDGSGLKLTVAKYLTPNYRDISLEGGISPDMVCRDHPRGLLPGGAPDHCVEQALRYVVSHPSYGGSAILGHTASR